MQSVRFVFTLLVIVGRTSLFMSMNREKVASFRKQLIERREVIAANLRAATAELISNETVYTDSVDQASAEIDKSFTLQLKNRERNVLVQIDEALRRLERGAYGDCERCGELISEGRMEAFPFTTLCIDCKAELESEEHRFPGRMN